MKEHRFPYKWTLKDAVFTKDKGTVFSCFACGGGSTMGYKLAGFDVIGCNEIDPKMIEAYKANHNPKYAYLEPIQTFKLRTDLPDELYNLDILDGSPPCSSFSMAGNREKDWGKDKIFREGQQKQILDTLFFDFIDLAKKLQPKVVVAENVKGLLLGEAKAYVMQIYKEFNLAGYHCQHWLLDASKMGVPQRRERVFFIALRKDLAKPFLKQMNLFDILPELNLEFKEQKIIFSEISDNEDMNTDLPPVAGKLWYKCIAGESLSSVPESNGSFFNDIKVSKENVLPTLASQNKVYHSDIPRRLNNLEYLLGATFPTDYDTKDMKAFYMCGMSVPPVMTAQIATQIYEQWLSKL
ncbi:MAG: DNA (cytosine-5-)-methyltransferase [Cytophagaceae bacterium]|nr:DNA (cytosine-5-)-methyltransferase [Cytophagaceae bacterium]